MKKASSSDIPYLCESLVKMTRFIKTCGISPYIGNLPQEVTPQIIEYITSIVTNESGFGLITENEDTAVGCILTEITDSNMSFIMPEKVGFISVCWVEPEFRRQGIARKLVAETETWLQAKGIHLVELSYMAQNTLAETSWQKMGYSPFRTFAYKRI